MRLIDANAFSRKMQDNFHGCYSEIQLAPYQVDRMFDNQPTVDAVPVVRCKNCKYYEPEGNYKTGKTFDYGYCYHWDYEQGESPNSVDSDDFCSYGIQKNADTHETD